MRLIRRNQRNFLPTLFIVFVLWLATTLIILFIDPTVWGIIPIIVTLLFFDLLFTLSLLLANTRRGVLLSTAITILIILSILRQATLINIILVAGIYIAFEMYSKRS